MPYDPITGHYDIRLDANESCFNLSDSLKEKIGKSISGIDFNRYPDCLAKAPTKAFSELYNVPEELISAGNGSDELISIIEGCFFEAGDTIVNVSHDFSMYEFYAQLYEVNVRTYQKEADLTIDPDKLIAFCRENKAKGLIFSNPCNPTSLGLDRASVKKIIEALDGCLVILDEVGRGTSTFDGVSIARAVAEHICTSKKLGCKTLFATHYHELIGLENELEGVKNYSIAVNKHGGTIRFLRKIVRGGVDESYGVDVAKLAGLPAKVVSRARELLEEMEKAHENERPVIKNDDFGQISFGSLGREAALDMLEKTNVDELSDSECRELLKDMLKAIQ